MSQVPIKVSEMNSMLSSLNVVWGNSPRFRVRIQVTVKTTWKRFQVKGTAASSCWQKWFPDFIHRCDPRIEPTQHQETLSRTSVSAPVKPQGITDVLCEGGFSLTLNTCVCASQHTPVDKAVIRSLLNQYLSSIHWEVWRNSNSFGRLIRVVHDLVYNLIAPWEYLLFNLIKMTHFSHINNSGVWISLK